MKKKISFRLLAIFMALIVCLVPTLTVLASAKGEESVPIITVHGLMASDIYVDANDPDSGLAWPPSTDAILTAVKDALPSIANLALTKNWEKFGDDLCDIVGEMFAPIYCGEDGTPTNGSGIIFEYPEPETITKDSIVKFKYDWRIDPIEVAAQLDKFIDYVLECSGSKTVKITCHSLGGVITNTYLTLYGDSKVSGVCFNSTAIFGQQYIEDLMTGNIVLNSDSLQFFLGYALDYNAYKTLINEAIAIIRAAGLMDVIVNLGNTIIENILEQAAREVLAPMFGGWLSIWAMIQDKGIAASEDFCFNQLYKGLDRSAIKAKIDRYNTLIRPNKEATLKKLNEHASVYVISRYGYCSIPLTPNWEINSDGVVDTVSTSFGATVAPFGETLSEEYLAKADPKYISPDKTLDASTCLFPEQTWFIHDMQHAQIPDSMDEMIYTLLRYDGQATVDTFDRYPRFNKYDYVNDVISPYAEPDRPMTFEYRLGLMVGEVIKIVVNLVKMLVDAVKQ